MAQYRGLEGEILHARQQATGQDLYNYSSLQDWRIVLSLAPGAAYLYRATDPGILKPLQDTDGVVFPYTPTINVVYTASYDPTEIIHSNYKIYQYKSSSIDTISITGQFTAQDTYEANYVLAVIHFFRSVTKMFYGQDEDPKNGTPPPLCYIYGYGEYQFNKHPIAITSFNYSLPNDVDYIRATPKALATTRDITSFSGQSSARFRLTDVDPGGTPPSPVWTGDREFNSGGVGEPTYVPTALQIQLTAIPIVSRLDISNRFSLKDYATGNLLRGSQNADGGGIW